MKSIRLGGAGIFSIHGVADFEDPTVQGPFTHVEVRVERPGKDAVSVGTVWLGLPLSLITSFFDRAIFGFDQDVSLKDHGYYVKRQISSAYEVRAMTCTSRSPS